VTDTPTEREHEGAWAKLRRRKEVQWDLAYAAGAGALLQVLGFLALAWYHGQWQAQIAHDSGSGAGGRVS
jgi:hypothetical protein